MKIITGDRYSGKTTTLIREAAKVGAYIVCQSNKEAHRIHQEADRMGLNIPLPISYRDFEEKRYYGKGCQFMIDNVEALANYMCHNRVLACTVNVDPENSVHLKPCKIEHRL